MGGLLDFEDERGHIAVHQPGGGCFGVECAVGTLPGAKRHVNVEAADLGGGRFAHEHRVTAGKAGRKRNSLRRVKSRQWVSGPREGLRCSLTLDVLGFWTFVAGDDVEVDIFPFVQDFETGSDDRRVMHKNILSCILGDEAEPFFIIPPFHFATGHKSLSWTSGRRQRTGLRQRHYLSRPYKRVAL